MPPILRALPSAWQQAPRCIWGFVPERHRGAGLPYSSTGRSRPVARCPRANVYPDNRPLGRTRGADGERACGRPGEYRLPLESGPAFHGYRRGRSGPPPPPPPAASNELCWRVLGAVGGIGSPNRSAKAFPRIVDAGHEQTRAVAELASAPDELTARVFTAFEGKRSPCRPLSQPVGATQHSSRAIVCGPPSRRCACRDQPCANSLRSRAADADRLSPISTPAHLSIES